VDDFRITDDPLRQAIDACRPGSQDARSAEFGSLTENLKSNPRLRSLFERTQSLDAKIVAALVDVPVPRDLSASILSRLSASAHESLVHVFPIEQPPTEIAQPAWRFRLRPSRRAGAAVAAALLVAAGLAFWGPGRPLDNEQLLSFAAAHTAQLSSKWNRAEEAPAKLAVPRSVTAAVRRWQPVDGFLGHSGVAYELVDAAGSKATLYVVRMKLPSLRTIPPSTPESPTGGGAVAAWRSDKLVYVLVVRGPDAVRRYRNFVSPTAPTLAIFRGASYREAC